MQFCYTCGHDAWPAMPQPSNTNQVHTQTGRFSENVRCSVKAHVNHACFVFRVSRLFCTTCRTPRARFAKKCASYFPHPQIMTGDVSSSPPPASAFSKAVYPFLSRSNPQMFLVVLFFSCFFVVYPAASAFANLLMSSRILLTLSLCSRLIPHPFRHACTHSTPTSLTWERSFWSPPSSRVSLLALPSASRMQRE